MKRFILCLFVLGSLVGCKDDDELTFEQQLAVDTELIDSFLAANNITAQIDASGLRYVIHEQGEGLTPEPASGIVAAYEGTFLDGEVFDSNSEFTFRLSNMIEGWIIGLPYIQEGGRMSLYIPSGLAYGTRGTQSGSIPQNTVITFTVEIIDIWE
ncbi:MAG: FKBP-type peptidyl-prolyl cis-trans isomerase [Cytophagales bacterium]|nr:FKBP-type peptidyl-prolyl cis-trans isomerase [Cytophagales bacterium]